MVRNIKQQLESLQKEIDRREAGLKKLREAKRELELEYFQQEKDELIAYMDRNNLDTAAVLKILDEHLKN